MSIIEYIRSLSHDRQIMLNNASKQIVYSIENITSKGTFTLAEVMYIIALAILTFLNINKLSNLGMFTDIFNQMSLFSQSHNKKDKSN